ncbi:alpha-2,8-sialyltransferase 8B-like [Branchiostoma floridae x Branchiostoma belcheri]
MVRATTPAETLKSCLENATGKKECSAITPIRHYSTCALVGNSGILLNSSCGDEIDSHDFVIRFNLGPLQDYSTDVGRNVNMTVVNRVIDRKLFPMFRKNKTSQLLNLLRPFNNSVLLLAKVDAYSKKFLKERKTMEKLMRERNLNMTIVLSNLNGTGWHWSRLLLSLDASSTSRLWSGLGGELKPFPTTGLLLLGEAITFCDHVKMFGFYPFNKDHQNRTIPYHYWRDFIAVPSKTPHKFVAEYKLLGALINDGIMNHTVDCNVIE